ncbi:MAG: hypothetical protein IJW53_02490 [Clostridia bacterium]|nr:hypothetical protein [Clostridia bacterium]
MKNRIISLLLIFILLFSFSACGVYNPPDTDEGENGGDTTPPDDNPPDNGGEEEEEPFVATVMLGGKPYTPPTVSDDSLALKVRWTDGKTYHTVNVDEDGKAECYGLDGDYAVTLINLSDDYTYNPNIYTASNDRKSVVIELQTLTKTRGSGNGLYSAIGMSKPGVYRAEIAKEGRVVYFEFSPSKAGTYAIESWVDVSAGMYDPVADVYYGSSQFKYYAYRLDGGGASLGYTTNFKHVVEVDEAFIGNCYTFAVFVNGKDATYPVNVDFAITYEGGYTYDWIVSNFVFPEFIPNDSTYSSWYSDYYSYLEADKAKYGSSDYSDAAVIIDGKRVFDQNNYKLNPDDGYYHVFDLERYAAYGGWGPILYAEITNPTIFIDSAFNTVEYAGNKALTVSSGTENYKLFIEGYDELIIWHGDVGPYFCSADCECYATNGGACTVEDNCKTCAENGCRVLPAKYKGQRGYADIAIAGRCPVTEELKEFLQKYSVNQKLFSDGNGWAEQYVPRYDAYEDSQWLFACGYYN